MMLISPTEQFLSDYTFTTPASGFGENFVNVVAPTDSVGDVKLDGAVVPGGAFTPIGSTGFSGAQLDLTLGSHTIIVEPSPSGIYVYGFDQADSYGYPGGAAYAAINDVAGLSAHPGHAGEDDQHPGLRDHRGDRPERQGPARHPGQPEGHRGQPAGHHGADRRGGYLPVLLHQQPDRHRHVHRELQHAQRQRHGGSGPPAPPPRRWSRRNCRSRPRAWPSPRPS